jgi:hypothetical protein
VIGVPNRTIILLGLIVKRSWLTFAGACQEHAHDDHECADWLTSEQGAIVPVPHGFTSGNKQLIENRERESTRTTVQQSAFRVDQWREIEKRLSFGELFVFGTWTSARRLLEGNKLVDAMRGSQQTCRRASKSDARGARFNPGHTTYLAPARGTQTKRSVAV